LAADALVWQSAGWRFRYRDYRGRNGTLIEKVTVLQRRLPEGWPAAVFYALVPGAPGLHFAQHLSLVICFTSVGENGGLYYNIRK
jgi:hypothetical protein